MLKVKSLKETAKRRLVVDKGSYSFIQVKPDSELTNGTKVEGVAKTLYSLYRSPIDRVNINFKKKCLQYKKQQAVSYEIYMDKDNINFYYIVPEDFKSIVQNKVQTTWIYSSVEPGEDKVRDLLYDKCSYGNLILKERSFKALKCNKSMLAPLPSLLAVSTDIQDSDKLLIQIILTPIDDTWQVQAEEDYEAYKKGDYRKKGGSKAELVLTLLDTIIDGTFGFIDTVLEVDGERKGDKKKKLSFEDRERLRLSMATNRKIKSNAFKGTIRVIAESENEMRRHHLINSVGVAFQELNENNELVVDRIRPLSDKDVAFIKEREHGGGSWQNNNIYGVEEVGQLLQLPTNELQKLFKMERIEVKEVQIPEALLKGHIRIGTNKYKGNIVDVHLPSSFDDESKPVCILGPSGGGKSKLLENILKDIANHTNPCILFDWIASCQLGKFFMSCMNPNEYVVYTFDDVKNCPRLDFVEMPIDESLDAEKRVDTAYNISCAVYSLLENIQMRTTNEITTRMLRYFTAACIATFVYKDNDGILEVIKILSDHKYRMAKRDKLVKDKILDEDDLYIADLDNLNKTEKGKVTGTMDSYVAGILDRFSRLTSSRHTAKMLKSKNSINMSDLIDQKKKILFLMPEDEFSNHEEKDLITSCVIAKTWLAQKQRDSRNSKLGKSRKELGICHIVMDEVNQVPGAMKSISSFITEVRKFGGQYIFTAQDMEQFGLMQRAISATGANYVIIKGTDEDIVRSLSKDLKPNYKPEDLDNVAEWSTINVIRINNVRNVFVTKLPKPLTE